MKGLHTLIVGNSACDPEQDDHSAPGFLIAWGKTQSRKMAFTEQRWTRLPRTHPGNNVSSVS